MQKAFSQRYGHHWQNFIARDFPDEMSLDAHHVQDVGRILVQVQDQLQALRSAIREETLHSELSTHQKNYRVHNPGPSASGGDHSTIVNPVALSSRLEEVRVLL